MADAPRPPSLLSLLWEAPLALLSRFLYRTIQLVVLGGCELEYRRDARAFEDWRVATPKRLRSASALLRVVMVGPRWNTAAVCGSAGPFRVEKRLEIDVGSARRSAEFWAILVYGIGPMRLVHYATGVTTPDDVEKIALDLEPGRYFLNARYYGDTRTKTFPRITIDGRLAVGATGVDVDLDLFLTELRKRTSSFYEALNYHAFVVARWKDRLPREWRRKVLLPVGDPGTHFEYGAIHRGEVLHLDFEPSLFESHRVFVTIYDRASFPRQWYEVRRPQDRAGASRVSGLYLVRVVRVRGTGGLPARPLDVRALPSGPPPRYPLAS